MEVLGIDVGFGFTKATDGKEAIVFKSLLGEATDIKFRTKIAKDSIKDNLHVTIDDKSYFVGDFAELQSNIQQYTLNQEKLISKFVKVLALTIADSFPEKYIPLNVVSGLPVGYLKKFYTNFTKILMGQHEITFHKADGSQVTRRININKVRMMPQPLGSVFNILMDDNGKIANKDLTKQKVGVVDIGFRTVDCTIMDQMRFVDRGSATMDNGISKSFSGIAQKLREETGVNLELYRLYKAVESGRIKIRGQEYALDDIKTKVFSHSAELIANDIERLWSDDWDIDNIILTGGGAKALGDYLIPLLPGTVMPIEDVVDPRLNNVFGYLKYAKYKWGNNSTTETATDEKAA